MTPFEKVIENGRHLWTSGWNDVRVCFAGTSPSERPNSRTPSRVPRPIGWADQVHCAEVLEASPGCAGPGDALYTRRRDLSLQVVTADCVPILIATSGTLVAIHAGWRGLACHIIRRATRALEPSSETVAWIGPAIGPCCYEVGREVATAVQGGSGSDLPEKVYLDLVAAARHQLIAAGLTEIESLDTICTSCSVGELWSYRRDGEAAGRNIAVIWRSAAQDRFRIPAALDQEPVADRKLR